MIVFIISVTYSVFFFFFKDIQWVFPGGSDDKESACNVREPGLIPGLGRDCYQFQYSCLENSMDRGAWQAIVHGIAKSWTRLSD